ncbi:MAG TPA: hypothetical protein VH025_06935 [Solirubrobacteraceae bacterium]|nr:hypothetical protein [Solirubrobacteraceae bacterium]
MGSPRLILAAALAAGAFMAQAQSAVAQTDAHARLESDRKKLYAEIDRVRSDEKHFTKLDDKEAGAIAADGRKAASASTAAERVAVKAEALERSGRASEAELLGLRSKQKEREELAGGHERDAVQAGATRSAAVKQREEELGRERQEIGQLQLRVESDEREVEEGL